MKNTLLTACLISFLGFCLTAQTPSLQWQNALGGSNSEQASSIQATSDGGYMVAGQAGSSDGDVTGNHGGVNDFWVVKLNALGSVQWQKSLGGSGYETAYAIEQTSDGGYIVTGAADSFDGDVTGNHGGYDYWVVKLNPDGAIQWQKSLGGTGYDDAKSITQTADGGYVIAGLSESSDGNVTSNHGLADYWIVKLSASGNLQWEQSLGGTNYDIAFAVRQADTGKFIVAGVTNSYGGDVIGNHGQNASDYWVLLLSENSSAGNNAKIEPQILFYPNPAQSTLTVQSGPDCIGMPFSMVDQGGQVVLSDFISDENQTIMINYLSTGVYFFQIDGVFNQIQIIR